LIIIFGLHPLERDDIFITFRYSDNLVKGNGFVYNPGDPYLGTTTPLYALILALSHFVSGNLLVNAAFISGISLWGCIVIIYFVYRHYDLSLVGCLFGFLISRSIIIDSSLGMESTFFMFLVLFFIWLYWRGHSVWAGIIGGLSVLTRPEGVFLVFVLVVWDIISRRRFNFRLYGGLCIPLLPWSIFSLIYFHTLIPRTVAVKYIHGNMGWRNTFWNDLWNIYFAHQKALWISTALGLLSIFLSRRKPFIIAAAFIVIYLIAYGITGVPSYIWYYVPVIMVFAVFASEGIIRPIYLLLGRYPKILSGLKWTAVLLLLGLTVYKAQGFQGIQSLTRTSRADLYQLTTWIRDNTPKDAKVMHNEIGVLGYYSHRQIVDTFGLANSGICLST